MKLIIGFLLLPILQQTTLGKTIVKRDCDRFNDCACSGSEPCNHKSTNNYNNKKYNSCEQNNSPCDQEEHIDKVPVLVPFPEVPQNQKVHNASTIVNNTNFNNGTFEVNLANTINTVNNISVPISINATNQNTITVYLTNADKEPEEEDIEIGEIRKPECCFVSRNRCDQNNECVRERHLECSDLCSGEFTEELGSTTTSKSIPETTPTLITESIPTTTTTSKPENHTQSDGRAIYYIIYYPCNYYLHFYQPQPIPPPQCNPICSIYSTEYQQQLIHPPYQQIFQPTILPRFQQQNYGYFPQQLTQLPSNKKFLTPQPQPTVFRSLLQQPVQKSDLRRLP